MYDHIIKGLRALPFVLLMSVLVLPAQARDVDAIDNPRQSHGGWVTDEPNILGDAAGSIEERLEVLNQQTGAEVAWIVLKSSGGREPRELATDLLHRWGVGRKDQDDGVVVLHVLESRRIEIVTGYGVESALPDIKCSWLLQEVAVPMFRLGEFARGHLALSRGIDRALRSPDISHADLIAATQLSDAEAGTTTQTAPRAISTTENSMFGPHLQTRAALLLVVLALGLYFWRVRMYRKRERLHDVNGVYFPNPLLLFVGMFLAAGGLGHLQFLPAIVVLAPCAVWTMLQALGERRALLLRQSFATRACGSCGRSTHLLSSDDAADLLTAGARREQELRSVLYEVRHCSCGAVNIESIHQACAVRLCPHCRFRTLRHVQTLTLKEATERETGQGQNIYECAECRHELREETQLPRVVRVSSSHSDSERSSHSSGSGSSSSSGGGSSFGGGDTGGGGAGASY